MWGSRGELPWRSSGLTVLVTVTRVPVCEAGHRLVFSATESEAPTVMFVVEGGPGGGRLRKALLRK